MAVGLRNAREGALIDLTGQWVSVITEDWRWRMVTPPKGDTASVPLNPAGRKVADAWDLNADRAGGHLVQGVRAAGIDSPARTPAHPVGERFHARDGVRCRNADTPLSFRTQRRQAAREPARAFRGAVVQAAAESRDLRPRRRGARRLARSRDDEPHAGYLRPNGVPYSERAVVKEFFDSFTLPEDGTWLIVTTVVQDPEYLTQEFVISSQFKKETDLSKWNPRPCDIPAPVAPARAAAR